MSDTRIESRYLSHKDAAAILGLSRTEIRNKVIAGQLVEVDLSSTGIRRKPGITRKSLDEYCDRLEAQAVA